jgi:NAD+ synthetase
MKIACAQINPIIADIKGNLSKIFEYIDSAKKEGIDLIIFPEMTTLGYPPMDLLENDKLIDDNIKAVNLIAAHSAGIAVICGYVARDILRSPSLLNAAAFFENGQVISSYYKSLLPTYDVFDEQRYFSRGNSFNTVSFAGKKIGITICEDIWNDKEAGITECYIEGRNYDIDPVEMLAEQGIDILVNISASPYVRCKNESKHQRINALSRRFDIPVVYVNQVGGNDSLVFDGGSFVSYKGRITAAAKIFNEDLLFADPFSEKEICIPEEDLGTVESALVLGLKDYCKKCGFKKAVLGLSGGIDSALTAVLAVKALGKENVMGVTMPSLYSSSGSIDDSVELARNLGIRIETVPIKTLYDQFNNDLSSVFSGYEQDVTEENLQARIRGNILMAMSNKFGSLLLTTGNKSELAMGYCTMYGDMSGGLAVISDLPKNLVYSLSEYINRNEEIIPRATIDKAPSAELREDQKDQDTLPPYDILDGILECYIERRMPREMILSKGYDPAVVDFVLRTVDRNEYKRRQAAPGLKVTTKAFGTGRRIPMAMKLSH